MAMTKRRRPEDQNTRNWFSASASGTAAASNKAVMCLVTNQSAPNLADWAPLMVIGTVIPGTSAGRRLLSDDYSRFHLMHQSGDERKQICNWYLESYGESVLDKALIFHHGCFGGSGGSGEMFLPETDVFETQETEKEKQHSTVANYIEDIESRLQLTRSQIAQALRVERATMYQWFRGAQPRSRKTLERIEKLRKFAIAWSDAELGSARSSWYFRQPNGQLTLGEMLTEEQLDEEKLLEVIQQMLHTPDTMEFVEPDGIYGFPAENSAEEQRRRNGFFAPTYSKSK